MTSGNSPCLVSGCTTSISVNSVWANQSITLLGNVSIGAGHQLLVYDATLSFTEPSTATRTAYGFNLTAGGAALYLVAGANVTQSFPATTNSWFLYTGTLNYKVDAENATWNAPSPNVVSAGKQAPFEHGFFCSTFNDSAFQGPGSSPGNDSLNVTVAASHSTFQYGVVLGELAGNDSLNYASAGVWAGNLAFGRGTLSLNWTTLQNLSPTWPLFVLTQPGFWVVSNGQPFGNLGVGQLYVSHSLFANWNVSYEGDPTWQASHEGLSYYGAGNNRNTVYLVANDTVRNVWTWRTAGDYLLYTDRNGGSYVAAADLPRGTVEHNSIVNVSLYGTAAHPGGINVGYAVGNANIRFNAVTGWNDKTLHTESGPFNLLGYQFNLTANRFQNFVSTPLLLPQSQNQVFNVQDQSNQIYSEVVAFANATMSLSCATTQSCGTSYTGPATGLAHNVVGNWLFNVTGQDWLVQLIGGKIRAVANTIVNANSAGAIGVSVNSGVRSTYVANNSVYGVYNFSLAIGSDEGGAFATNYSGNTAYDVDVSSWAFTSSESNESWTGEAGNASTLYLLNTNGTNGIGPGKNPTLTTNVTLAGSSFAAIATYGLVVGTNATRRAPLSTDFNVTVAGSTVPASLTQLAYNFSQQAGANPSFLTIRGSLGVFGGTRYSLSGQWVRGGASSTITCSGSPVATLPASSYGYTLAVNSSTSYSVGASSWAAPPLPLYFAGLYPGTSYQASWATPSGRVLSTVLLFSNQLGVLTVSFTPASLPLNVTVSVVAVPGPPFSSAEYPLLLSVFAVGGGAVALAIVFSAESEGRRAT